MFTVLAALYLTATANSPSFEPTVNLTAIRQIDCVNAKGQLYQGSGYMTAKDTIFSVLHVAEDKAVCKDHASGVPISAYYKDPNHDFTIFKGAVPLRGPYIKYSCEPFHKDEAYSAYGFSGLGYDDDKGDFYSQTIFRQYGLTGTGEKTDMTFKVEGAPEPGLSMLQGRAAPGTSGGPIVDKNGYAHGGVNVGGVSIFGLPMGPTFSYALHDTTLCNSQ